MATTGRSRYQHLPGAGRVLRARVQRAPRPRAVPPQLPPVTRRGGAASRRPLAGLQRVVRAVRVWRRVEQRRGRRAVAGHRQGLAADGDGAEGDLLLLLLNDDRKLLTIEQLNASHKIQLYVTFFLETPCR